MRETFDRAARLLGSADCWYRIAGHPVRIRFAGTALQSLLAPALEHLATEPVPGRALTLCVWDIESVRGQVPAPPWRLDGEAHGPELRVYHDGRVQAAFDVATGTLSVLDRADRLAWYCVRDPRELPGWEFGTPFKLILHWALRDHGRQLVHAAAVGRADGGVLLVGKGGAGKSTTALSCLGSELRYAADDYCMLSADPMPYAHSLYNSAKVYAQELPRFPALAGARCRLDAPGMDKALLFLHPHVGNCVTAGFPIRAVLVPSVAGGAGTTACAVPASVALRALAPSTMFQVIGPDPSTLAVLAAYVKRLPCYALRLGPRLAEIPHVITDVLARVPQPA